MRSKAEAQGEKQPIARGRIAISVAVAVVKNSSRMATMLQPTKMRTKWKKTRRKRRGRNKQTRK